MKTKGMWLMVACAFSLTAFCQENDQSGTASAIRALEREWVVAQSRNDSRALDMIFDHSLVYIEYGRLVTKGDYLSRIKRTSPQLSQIVMEPVTVRAFGSTAIAIGSYRESSVRGGRVRVKRWRFLDTWVYKKGSWMLVASGAAPLTE
ncbi:MAG TPA: nuclear transport factor 2 family protein [Candidatus Binatus sp.]|nr:nuclear transport factor 2 family protein [Candidatus Binatus sp.]